MRIPIGIALICAFGFVAGCSISGDFSTPVNAQSTYSNASLFGTYSINMSGISSTSAITSVTNISGLSASLSSFLGAFAADGNGNVTGALAQLTASESGLGSCSVTLKGTYNIQSNAGGTMNLTVTSKQGTASTGTGTSTCTWNGPVQFAIELGMQGQSVHLAEADGQGLITGMATRQ